MKVAVVGASGFVGSACVARMRGSANEVIQITAPRLSTAARTPELLAGAADAKDFRSLARQLAGCNVLVNAAGVADAASAPEDQLYGGNALLPLHLIRAGRHAGVTRFLHISTAAVQGRMAILDESERREPFSAYSTSKAMGEAALPRGQDVVILRPTSVHGPERSITRRVAALARSPKSCVAGQGFSPTPQVHVANVAAAVEYLTRPDLQPPRIVLQPWEGWCTASFLALLGHREPHHVPVSVARAAVSAAYLAARYRPSLVATARRGEMLLFGQGQQPGWLDTAGYSPAADVRAWREMAAAL